MSHFPWRRCVAVVAAALLIGCGGSNDTTIPPVANVGGNADMDILFARWEALAEAPADELDFQQALSYTMALAEADELDRILNVLGDIDANPKAKVLAVVSLSAFLSHGMVDQVLALTQPGHETTTRAGAAKLLGTMLLSHMRPPAVEGMITPPTEEDLTAARARLRELASDEEHKVRFTAATLLARVGDEAALDQLVTLWHAEETDANERMELVYSLPQESGETFKEIFKQAAVDTTLDPEVRQRALVELGLTNDPELTPFLDEVSASDPDAGVRAQAKIFAEGIRAQAQDRQPAREPAAEESATTTADED
jgi:HEAT repeat protein